MLSDLIHNFEVKMGRGPVIERQKALVNALRGKTFTIHAKLISLAAQKGGDPDKNPTLHEAIEKAKKDNVPSENIARAIRKGTGEDKEGIQIQEIYYEGYGVGGVGIIAKTLTDNRNRTTSSIRHIFSKYGGSLGETGSVSNFAFKFMGVCYISLSGKKLEEIEEYIIESGAEDYNLEEDDTVRVLSQKQDLASVVKYLKEKGLEITEYGLEYIANSTIGISDFDKALKIIKLVEDLEGDEDIEKVWHNYDISDEMQNQAIEAIEKAKFRT
ncbi:MAG: YebC/PmpR family DNA-binding transcriptional regulator [Candidatus Gracilibacteria bacterium]|nr:YebC/PmpR family DNA-binding transcriptional regulator [Candidatus Gracilibacteria bacterium]